MMTPDNLKFSILIVEDDPILLLSLTGYFEARGYAVHPAREREEAEALLHKFKYSAIITDLALNSSRLSGLDILATIKALPQTPKVVILTGHCEPDIRLEAQLNGADAFISKPAPLAHIASVIDHLVGAVA